jgi:hypothetical protein
MTLSTRISADLATQDREFAAVDTKGRTFGARVLTLTATYVARTDGMNWGYNIAPGTIRYEARPHALRDGQMFGASQGTRSFETVAERDAWIARYFKDAEKRALKNKARAA